MFWRRSTVSPRRARRMYEAERLATQLADLRRENARREQERNRPCRLCVAAGLIPTEEAR